MMAFDSRQPWQSLVTIGAPHFRQWEQSASSRSTWDEAKTILLQMGQNRADLIRFFGASKVTQTFASVTKLS